MIEKLALKMTHWIGSPSSLIIHTIFFAAIFILLILGIEFDLILLVLTTLVSLEAIYLAIFIQMSVNRQSKRLASVRRDIDEIQEDVAEITEDIDEIQEDVEEISEEMEEDDKEEEQEQAKSLEQLQKIEDTLYTLIKEIEAMRGKNS